jgi:phage shock protein A
MLLNEFLKEYRKVERLEGTVAQQQKDFQGTTARSRKEIKALTATVKEQEAQIQKVNAGLKMTRPASQVAENNQNSCPFDVR